MRKGRFTDEQVIAVLREAERGNTDEVVRRQGISRDTFYRWRKQFGGMDVGDARRLKALEEEENRRLKRVAADQAPERGGAARRPGKRVVTAAA